MILASLLPFSHRIQRIDFDPPNIDSAFPNTSLNMVLPKYHLLRNIHHHHASGRTSQHQLEKDPHTLCGWDHVGCGTGCTIGIGPRLLLVEAETESAVCSRYQQLLA